MMFLSFSVFGKYIIIIQSFEKNPLSILMFNYMQNIKKTILICFFILFGCSANASLDGIWTAFRSDDSDNVEFREAKGKIKAKIKDTAGFIVAKKFDKIIAAMDEKNGKYESYYLTKAGKKVWQNSVYIFDNTPDCEGEGFIRFRDKKTHKAGMINGMSEIVIPAQYNDLTNVRGGLVMAIKDAKKKYWHENEPSGCNHFSWVEGEDYLIDTNNKIIIDNFKHNYNLNLYSFKIENAPTQDANRQSFRGADDRYYSFINYEKEFKSWLNEALFSSLSKDKLIESSYGKIYFWKEPEGWKAETSSAFIDKNFELIKNRLSALMRNNAGHLISIDGLNPFIYEGAEFEIYYNNCGQPKEWQYPVITVVIDHKIKNASYQDHFEFLRTNQGYKLISLDIRDEKLK